MDKKISCVGLLLGAALSALALAILVYQIVEWLSEGIWIPLALEDTPVSLIRIFGKSWIGAQRIYDWLLAIPATIGFALLAFLLFWSFGIWSAKLYQR